MTPPRGEARIELPRQGYALPHNNDIINTDTNKKITTTMRTYQEEAENYADAWFDSEEQVGNIVDDEEDSFKLDLIELLQVLSIFAVIGGLLFLSAIIGA